MPHSINESDSDSPIPLVGLRWNNTRGPILLHKVYSQLWCRLIMAQLWQANYWGTVMHNNDKQTTEAWLWSQLQ